MLGSRCSSIKCESKNQAKPYGPSSGKDKVATVCTAGLKSCPSGHEMKTCDDKTKSKCVQCQDRFFQPDRNGPIDKCKVRKSCSQYNMAYADVGSTVRDATCKCIPGHHFSTRDENMCIPNGVCPRGYGQMKYGGCEPCTGGTFSDMSDTKDICRQVTNCEKKGRCTVKRSDGTFDNVCSSYTVKDISTCGDHVQPREHLRSSNSKDLTPIIAGAVVAGVALAVIVFFIIMFVLWKRRRAQGKEDPLSKDQIESLLDRIVRRSDGDEPYSRKVIAAAFREIEDRIDRQIWKLPQELFRDHMQPAMYEVVVEKYKDKDHKYAINGYLQDWREWKGENSEAISHLFKCLRQVEREDIVFEICNKFREGYPEVVMDAEVKLDNGIVKKRNHKITFSEFLKEKLCCSKNRNERYDKNNEEQNETKDSLLAENDGKSKELEMSEKEAQVSETDNVSQLSPLEAGAIYRDRPSPSAPVIDDAGNVHVIIPMNRAYSFPVQAIDS